MENQTVNVTEPIEASEAEHDYPVSSLPRDGNMLVVTVVAEVHVHPGKYGRDDIKVSKAFEDLRVPEVKTRKRTTLRSTLPKAISGTEALEILREREEKKEQEMEEKEMRKNEREKKRN